MIREPVVAGQFYPAKEKELRVYLENEMEAAGHEKEALGIIAPHAGYYYSGSTAAKVFGAVKITRTVLLLGPNHTGHGHRAAVYPSGAWRTPLGLVSVNEELARMVEESSRVFTFDFTAHAQEHSIEVLLPFLQVSQPGFDMVPISFMLSDAGDIKEAGEALYRVVTEWGEPLLMVVSSDMTHYESQENAMRKDALAIAHIEKIDPEGLLRTVASSNISMCGVIPAAVMLYAARKLGAVKGEKVAYSTSGEKSGDFRHVVGYAGMVIT
ncbi:AmmeMemoRadiSam system protein B [bacterium]|nr:MAG: AmmeMemoRadiSam system protein B [bacterium]